MSAAKKDVPADDPVEEYPEESLTLEDVMDALLREATPFKDFFKNAQFIQGAFDRRAITENEYRFNLARCGLFLWENEATIPEPPVVEDEEVTE